MPSGIYKRTKDQREKFILNLHPRPKGFKQTEEWILGAKMRGIEYSKFLPRLIGESHPNWKEKNVGYRALHYWIRRKIGEPTVCTHCGKVKSTPRSIQWENKSKEYKRDISDWISLCVKCHRKYDKE